MIFFHYLLLYTKTKAEYYLAVLTLGKWSKQYGGEG